MRISKGLDVLVLGGSYFIGRHTVEQLHNAGHHVSVLNRGTQPVASARQLLADRDDPIALRRALDGAHFDAVVDFSAYTKRQVDAVLDALQGRFSHWLFVSSGAVYGDNRALPSAETGRLGGHPAWASYGRDKSDAESFLRASVWADRITIVRPPYVYGPGNNLERERFLFSRLLRGRPVLIPGSGQTVCQFLHVDDLARAITRALEQPKLAGGKTYNLGDAHAVTLEGWVHTAAEACGVTPRIVSVPHGCLGLSARSFFPLRDLTMFLDTRSSREELGFTPEFSLRSGLEHTLAHEDRARLAEQTLDLTVEDQLLAHLNI